MQGYDSAQLLGLGLRAVGGDMGQRQLLYRAMASAEIDSPRGRITLSPSHNVVQDFYLRKVENGENKSIGLAAKALADPGRGCTMGDGPMRRGHVYASTRRVDAAAARRLTGDCFVRSRPMDVQYFCPVPKRVQYGLLLFLVASGLTLIFGIMGVINLAHGSLHDRRLPRVFARAGVRRQLGQRFSRAWCSR